MLRGHRSTFVVLSALTVAATAKIQLRPSHCRTTSAACHSSSSNDAGGLQRFIFDKLKPEDIQEAANLFDKAFPLEATHSWGRALGLKAGIGGFMAGYLPPHVNNADLGCLAARDTQNKKSMLGCLILEPFPSPSDDSKPKGEETEGTEEDEATIDANTLFAYQAIDGILIECKNIFRQQFRIKHNTINPELYNLDSKCGYVAWIAVDQSTSGMGLAGALVRQGSDIMRQSGCRFAIAFTVSPRATYVFEKEGYERWGYIKYQDYELDGKKPFHVLPDEVSIMVKDLTKR